MPVMGDKLVQLSCFNISDAIAFYALNLGKMVESSVHSTFSGMSFNNMVTQRADSQNNDIKNLDR